MSEQSFPFDPTPYLRAPVLDVPTAVALGIALLTASDRKLPVPARKAARALRAQIVTLQSDWAAQRDAALQTRVDPRPIDQRLDRAWSAMGRSLEVFAALGEHVAQAASAAALHAKIFPEGLGFLTFAHEKQWAESEQRLRLFDAEELGGEVGQLLPEFVLTELRAAHEAYGAVLGITDAKPAVDADTGVLDSLRGVQQAIVAYGLQLAATAFASPELVPLVRSALRPLDDLRESQARRTAARKPTLEPDPAITPETPVPVLEALESA